MECLKLERIAESNKVIHGSRGQAKAEMKIELLVRCDLKGRAGVQQMVGSSTLRKVAPVLDKSVLPSGDLSI